MRTLADTIRGYRLCQSTNLVSVWRAPLEDLSPWLGILHDQDCFYPIFPLDYPLSMGRVSPSLSLMTRLWQGFLRPPARRFFLRFPPPLSDITSFLVCPE